MPRKDKFIDPPVIVIDYPNRTELLFKGISETAKSLGYGVLDLNYTLNSIIPGTDVVGLLTHKGGHSPFVQDFLKKGCQAVRLGNLPGDGKDWGTKSIPSILPDISAGGRMAADHFADRMFRDVGFIGNYPWRQTPYFFNAFHERAQERNCKCHLLQIRPLKGDHSIEKVFENKRKQILDWMKKLPKPIGVLTYSDANAASIFTMLRFGGIKVPEEVALLGLGNKPLICDFLPVPLSSIGNNEEEQGSHAVKLLHRLIKGEKIPGETEIMIPPKEVAVRQSTNLLAVPDPDVATAVRFIWNHFHEQLSIDDVARATGVARSTLTRKFRKHLNHGINAELRRKRLENSKALLRSSGMVIEDIAMESGFPNLSYFYRAFRKVFATTPEKYRKEYNLSQN